MLATSAITVDHISGGRIEVGIGAGGGDKDAAALGMALWSPAERTERLAEQLAILDRALRGEAVDHHGRHYRVELTGTEPVQQPRPPIVVAAQGPKTMRLVAKYADGIDELIFYWPTDPAVRAERERVIERVSLDVLPALRS